MKPLGLDCDGVICVRPLWARLVPYSMAPKRSQARPHGELRPFAFLNRATERIRFASRHPVADVETALERLGAIHELVLVTSRSIAVQPQLESWLTRHGLNRFFAGVYHRPPDADELEHKLEVTKKLATVGFVEDNPYVARYLADNGQRVFLMAAQANYPSIQAVSSLNELADMLTDEIS